MTLSASMAEIIAANRRVRRDTIGDAVARASAKFRDRIALRFEKRVWSFRALDDAANGIAAHLLSFGLKRGDRVAAYGRNSDTYLLAFIACCKAGLIHVPANYALTSGELAYVLKQSGTSLLMHDETLEDTAADAAGGLPRLLFSSLLGVTGAKAQSPIGDEIEDGDIAQILYTSGTTGRAEGRDADPSRASRAICELHHGLRVHGGRSLAGFAAALSCGANAYLHHAPASDGRGDAADRKPCAGVVSGTDRDASPDLVLLAADSLDQSAAAP